jgi:hypothetical protein
MCGSQQPVHHNGLWSILHPLSQIRYLVILHFKWSLSLSGPLQISLGFIKLGTKWQNLNSVGISQSHRMHEAFLSCLFHISQVGPYIFLSLNRYPLDWQCPSRYLDQFLFSSSSSLDLLAGDSQRKSCTCFYPGTDLQYFWWFLSSSAWWPTWQLAPRYHMWVEVLLMDVYLKILLLIGTLIPFNFPVP